MALQGHLSKFSLPEIFQFLEKGYKTGLLSVRVEVTSMQAAPVYYIWLHQGRIVAAANRLDSRRLLTAIATRGWVDDTALENVSATEMTTGLGLHFKSKGLLDAEQLKLLFRSQITGNIYPIFQFTDGEFEFDPKALLPQAEMTGLSIPATEATLMGLRALQDWTLLVKKLPDPKNSLASQIQGQPRLNLLAQELQVWDYTDGKTSLNIIAQKLGISVQQVQQIAFRLIVSNLAEEVFVQAAKTTANSEETKRFEDFDLHQIKNLKQPTPQPHLASHRVNYNDEKIKAESVTDKNRPSTTPAKGKSESTPDSSKANISQSFLQNLVGFLQARSST